MTNLEQRVYHLELDLISLQGIVADISRLVGNLAQQIQQLGFSGLGGGGGGSGVYFCLPTSLAGATGTWPSLVPGTQNLTVYGVNGTTITSLGTQTVKNWYPAAAVASKVLEVVPDGSGAYVAVAQSCT